MRKKGQKLIKIESETFTASTGDEIHSVTLRVNGLVVELSVLNSTTGEIRPADISIHDLNEGEVTIFADKVTKKKKSHSGYSWTSIKVA